MGLGYRITELSTLFITKITSILAKSILRDNGRQLNFQNGLGFYSLGKHYILSDQPSILCNFSNRYDIDCKEMFLEHNKGRKIIRHK